MKRIAIIGVRGIPVVYSGFETFAEELSIRLVGKGIDVTVFCRKHAVDATRGNLKGVKLIRLPSIATRSLDTLTHSMVSTLYACFMNPRPDIIYYLGVGSSIFSVLPRIFGITTVVNVDGLDWKRGKWGRFARWYLHLSEILAVRFSNLAMTDSDFIQKYYKRVYKKSLPVIPYGYSREKIDLKILRRYSLEKGKYLIWTGRLVPDNHLDELLTALSKSSIKLPLIVLGDSPNEEKYIDKLHHMARGLNVNFLGFVDRITYATLVASSRAYIETKRSGGTHPSLVESMGHGCLILANNHKSHIDVLGETAIFYKRGDIDSLRREIKRLCNSGFDSERVRLSKMTKSRAEKYYSWDAIVDKYIELFVALLN